MRQRIKTELTLTLFLFSSFFILDSTHYFQNKFALYYLHTMLHNFIKWLALEAFISKVRNPTKLALTLIFLYEICFLLAHFYFKCNLKNLEWYQIKQEQTIYCIRFLLKFMNKSWYKGLLQSHKDKGNA